jgi:hypothetical protein
MDDITTYNNESEETHRHQEQSHNQSHYDSFDGSS